MKELDLKEVKIGDTVIVVAESDYSLVIQGVYSVSSKNSVTTILKRKDGFERKFGTVTGRELKKKKGAYTSSDIFLISPDQLDLVQEENNRRRAERELWAYCNEAVKAKDLNALTAGVAHLTKLKNPS